MTKFLSTTFILTALLVAAPTALGSVVFGGHMGYARGTLVRASPEAFVSLSTQGSVGYEISGSGFQVHGFVQSMDLSYTADNEAYQGFYSLAGLGGGYSIPFSRGAFTFLAQLPLSSAYIVLSETTGTVNGSEYIESTLTTLDGGSAFQVMSGYQLRVIGSGKRSSENVHVGMLLGYLAQTFTKQTTRIRTNNSELAPVSGGESSVSYRLSVMSLNLTFSYDL